MLDFTIRFSNFRISFDCFILIFNFMQKLFLLAIVMWALFNMPISLNLILKYFCLIFPFSCSNIPINILWILIASEKNVLFSVKIEWISKFCPKTVFFYKKVYVFCCCLLFICAKFYGNIWYSIFDS